MDLYKMHDMADAWVIAAGNIYTLIWVIILTPATILVIYMMYRAVRMWWRK